MQVFEALSVKNIEVRVEGYTAVAGADFSITSGAVHALMGPNGSGKSSLAYAIAGHPSYEVVGGTVQLGDQDLLSMTSEARASAGVFLSFQEPPEVGGIAMNTFLNTIAARMDTDGQETVKILPKLGLDGEFLTRYLNAGFSGGEKKKSEVLQLIVRRPKIAILDEVDAGLDVDALRGVVALLKDVAKQGTGLLLISHSPRLFRMIQPDHISIMIKGKVAAEGGMELVDRVESEGYKSFV